MSAIDRATKAAAREVNELLAGERARREFTVSKFGRHADGYLHARVVVNGRAFYFHDRWGSWLAPGHSPSGRELYKEPEALLGSLMGREVKWDLAAKARTWRERERRALEAEKNARQPAQPPGDTGRDGQTVPATGV